MAARPILPIEPEIGESIRPPARRRAVSLLQMLLAALVLLAPLSACAPAAPVEDTEVTHEAGLADPTSQAPVQSPTATDTAAEPDTTVPATDTPSAEAPPAETAAPAPAPAPEAAGGTALAMLGELEEKGRAPKIGYNRDSFGWRDDLDRNGCDTRNDILRRDLHQITLKSGTGGCLVLRGVLDSPYSGESVSFDRADSSVDIDHVVALSDAWQTGAASWGEDTRRELANDPLNLIAVEESLNRQKGAGDAATWLPPKRDYRCEYVARQIAVKAKYDLWVKPAEADAMERVHNDCEGFPSVADDVAWPATREGAWWPRRPSQPTPRPLRTRPRHPRRRRAAVPTAAACTTRTAMRPARQAPHRCARAIRDTAATWTVMATAWAASRPTGWVSLQPTPPTPHSPTPPPVLTPAAPAVLRRRSAEPSRGRAPAR